VIIHPTGLVEEKALVWFFHALKMEGPAVNRRIAIEAILEDIASKKDRRGHSKGWLFDRVQTIGLTGIVDPNAHRQVYEVFLAV